MNEICDEVAVRRTEVGSGAKGPSRVLLAEDDTDMRTLLADAFRRAGYEIVECANGISLLQGLQDHLGSPFSSEVAQNIDLVVSDIRMPFVSGLDVLRALHKRRRLPPMILITAFGDAETHARAREFGAVSVFDKPFDIDELVARALELVPCSPDSPRDDKERTSFSLDVEFLENRAAVLSIKGTVDVHTLGEFEESLEGLLEVASYNLVIDFSAVDCISSAGIVVLTKACAVAVEHEGGIVIVNPRASVREVFDLLGVGPLLRIARSREEALSALRAEESK